MKLSIDLWLKSGKYLPRVLRDFHDQKDLFKALHRTTNLDGNEYVKDIDWVKGHIYVIDIFLWWMAKRGYTLQKSRYKTNFRNLADDIKACNEARMQAFKQEYEKQFGQPKNGEAGVQTNV